jgi:hypothetical protein
MTSETLYIINQLRQDLTNRNVIFPKGYDSVFRDPESNLLYYRQFGNSNEYERFPPIDTEGNFFYLRYLATETSTFEEINRQSSCKERFRQTINLRGVFVFTANDQFEVGDYTLNMIIGTQLAPFNNVNEIRINPSQIQYDYFNWNEQDTGGEIRTYMPAIQSFAIDINITFAREFDECRNPPELI